MASVSCLNTSWSAAVVCGRRTRSHPRHCNSPIYARASGQEDVAVQAREPLIVVKSPVPSRAPASLPEPVPIEHSSAYLLRTSKHKETAAQLDSHFATSDDEPFSGNAVDWVLRKVDESLEDVEENPPAYAKAFYDISTGPVGEAASKGAVVAAKMTVEVGTQALKAAAPVGKWVLTQGFKAAAGAVGYGLSSALKKGAKKDKRKS